MNLQNVLNDVLQPSEVRTNRDTTLIKIIAMLTMLCDHCGKVIFPQYTFMRSIGRLAFPIYAYCIAVGCVYTHDLVKYVKRMAFVAILSQPLYAVALSHTNKEMYAVAFADNPISAVFHYYLNSWKTPSIMLTLMFGILIIWTLREKHFELTAILAVLVWYLQSTLSYGWKGVWLIVLFYLTCTRWWLMLPIVSAYMLAVWSGTTYSILGFSFGRQTMAILSLPLILIPMNTGIKLNKWIFYLFYPGHLLAIIIVLKCLGRI